MKAHFEQPARLATGSFLLGHYRWPVDMRLVRTSIIGKSPATPTILGLEVDGELAAPRIYLLPSAMGESRLSLPLDLTVNANQEVRWKVLVAPAAAEGQASEVALELEVVPAGIAVALSPASRFWVQWVNGHERLRLFHYSPNTRSFTETIAGIANGRAAIVNATQFVVSIQSTVAMQITAGDVLKVNELVDSTDVGRIAGPVLEFWQADSRSERRLGRLSKAGVLLVPDVTEDMPAASPENFEWLGGGVLKASLGKAGLTADSIEEGI